MYLDQLPAQDNIIKLFDVMKDENGKDLYLAFEYLESDLHAVIRAGILEEKHLKYITYQILQCLKHLHKYDLIHRDLKPSNILLTPQCKVKVADFGNSRSIKAVGVKESLNLTRDIGTRWYSAPEMLLGSKSYGKPIDMWALGCLFGEMIAGKPLFRGTSTVEQVAVIFSIIGWPTVEDIKAIKCPISLPGLGYLPKLDHVPLSELCKNAKEEAFDFLTKLLTLNPEKRLNVEQALQHPFMSMFSAEEEPAEEPAADLKYEIELYISDNDVRKSEDYRCAISEYIEARDKKPRKDKAANPIIDKLTYLRYVY